MEATPSKYKKSTIYPTYLKAKGNTAKKEISSTSTSNSIDSTPVKTSSSKYSSTTTSNNQDYPSTSSTPASNTSQSSSSKNSKKSKLKAESSTKLIKWP